MRKETIDDRAIGQIGLLMVAKELMMAGFHVALPMMDVGYDIVAMKGGRLWRIQVKATARMNGRSNRVRMKRGRCKRDSYTKELCDALVAVHVRKGAIACLTVEQLKGRTWMSFAENACANPFDALQ